MDSAPASAERKSLLDRLTELNRGDPFIAALSAPATIKQLREIVASMEEAQQATRQRDGRLAAIWREEGGILVQRVRKRRSR